MKTFYIDYTGDSLGNSSVKFHGGGDFSRFIIWKLHNKIADKTNYQIVLLWPEGVNVDSLSEEEMKIRKTFKFIEINSIDNVKYCNGDVLFLPLLDCLSVKKIGFVKKTYPFVKVYGVLHGTRLLDVCKYDKYDKYYYTGIKSFLPYLWVRRWIAGWLSIYLMKQNLPLIDKLYTVSNSSMQKINSIANTKYLKFFYRTISENLSNENRANEKFFNDRFILFINSNRYEKNFIRSLIAFCQYKEENHDNLKLYVLGANKILIENIKRIKDINYKLVEDYVVFLGYLDVDKLRALYCECEFLLYTSKSEGYGLPPMEVLEAGRPSVVSSITSVPEVLGMSAYYVNPFSINDIKEGIKYMSLKENQMKYVKMFPEMKKALIKRGTFDIEALIDELIE